MGMSTHIVGFLPPDAEWNAKVDAWRACVAAGVEPPDELCEYLGLGDYEPNNKEPDPAGREVEVTGVREWTGEYEQGIEVDLVKLAEAHPEVKRLRFYNSW